MHSSNDKLPCVPGDSHAFDFNGPQREQDDLYPGDYVPQFPLMFATIYVHVKKFKSIYSQSTHHLLFL
jgi:hypothetical protein